MLQILLFANIFLTTVLCSEGHGSKPYVFPIPFELPNRNDRAEQCWIRIEDGELIETIAVYCYIAHEFLRDFIPDYNSRRMAEDDVDVSLWNEEPRSRQERPVPKPVENSSGKELLDWKVTTVMDPTTRLRIYVSQKADCKLVMYSREGMTNYAADCHRLLYCYNEHMSSGAVVSCAKYSFLAIVCIIVNIVMLLS